MTVRNSNIKRIPEAKVRGLSDTSTSEIKETKVKVNLIERRFIKLANDFKEHTK